MLQKNFTMPPGRQWLLSGMGKFLSLLSPISFNAKDKMPLTKGKDERQPLAICCLFFPEMV